MNNESTSLKNYYFNIQELYNNALMLLNSINNAFSTYSSQVTVTIDNNTYKLPSFLYLDNKINEINNTLSTLFEIPNNGEGWYIKDGNSYKLNILQSNVEPATPTISFNDSTFNIETNNIFKDLVNPKTYIKINIDNISSNINTFLMKKVILHNDDLITNIFNDDSPLSLSDFNEKVYLLNKDIDYSVYDSKIERPIKEYIYESKFDIISIVGETLDKDTNKTQYTIKLSTNKYYNKNDKSITHELRIGDKLTLSNQFGIYQITNTTSSQYDDGTGYDYLVDIIEINGHNVLKPTEKDENMYFVIYNNYINETDNYINIPLEENPYILVFISSIYNGVKSNWSNAIKLNLNNITIYDSLNNKQVNYIEYYNTYCKNIGDIIYAISDIIYPQLVKYTNIQLKELTSSKTIQSLVTDTLSKNNNPVLNITVINKHLIDDDISVNLTNLQKQKVELINNLSNIQSNIDNIYNKIISTDFSVEVQTSKSELNKELNSYYSEKTVIQKQLLSIVDNIDIIKNNVIGYDSLKFRVRGITNVNDLDESGVENNITAYLKQYYGYDCELIGLEVEYKYKNINNNTTTVENNSNTIFTDWNRINNIDKQRSLKFDPITNTYTIEYTNYDTNLNIIKWNQIDIPISFGEDVVIRIRYKYNIGQPFINIYTPWSDETTISYNEDMLNISDITDIFRQNETDVYKSLILKELINSGYQEHIDNKLIDNSIVFYHQPENIFSGFTTADNNLISLKDKLYDITNELNSYKAMVDEAINENYAVYFSFDDSIIELNNSSTNVININYAPYDILKYITKTAKIIIKNTGVNPIKLYSIFPGNTDIPLLHADTLYENMEHYERVPLVYKNVSDIRQSIYMQKLGQWIYFRQNNLYTKESYYNQLDKNINNRIWRDIMNNNDNAPKYDGDLKPNTNNYQNLLAYRPRTVSYTENIINTLEIVDGIITPITKSSDISEVSLYDKLNLSKFIYSIDTTNKNSFVLKYEHYIKSISTTDTGNQVVNYLTSSDDITYDLITNLTKYNNVSNTTLYGAFFIPELESSTQLLCSGKETNQYKRLDVGESLVIPCCIEYYLSSSELQTIVKTISFDIKTSAIKPITNYIISLNISNNLSETDSNVVYTPQVISDLA